jgi:Family of unknown function (DUF6627)
MRSMKKMTCRALVVSLLALSFQTANAGMIGADQAAAGAAQADRGMVLSYLSRAETAAQLEAQGIDAAMARERVALMTDQEVRTLAQDMQTAPAGADAVGWVAVILIAGAVWYFFFRK